MKLGEYVKTTRLRKKMTQGQLGATVGRNRHYIARIENMGFVPVLAERTQLAYTMGVDPITVHLMAGMIPAFVTDHPHWTPKLAETIIGITCDILVAISDEVKAATVLTLEEPA